MREGALVIRRARGRGLVVVAAAGCSVQAGRRGQQGEQQRGYQVWRLSSAGGEYGRMGREDMSCWHRQRCCVRDVSVLLVETACWDRGALLYV